MKRRLPDSMKKNEYLAHHASPPVGNSNPCFPMRILLIIAATIPFFLVSSLFASPLGGKASSKASIPSHVSKPEDIVRVSKDSKNKRKLDFVIHVGLPKTGTTTVQGAMGWSLYDQLVEKDSYYFLGKTRGIGPLKKLDEEKRKALKKDEVRKRLIAY
jgi:hypothetical protein